MQPKYTQNLTLITLCAVMGLACMFGGIWISDSHLITAESVPGSYITMRLATLFVYVVLFLAAIRFCKHSSADMRFFIGPLSVLGMALFLAGALLLFYVVPQCPQGSPERSALSVLAVICAKTIGAPVSVGLVCVFARLDRATVMRACVMGMLGAFALYSLFIQESAFSVLGKEGSVVVSAVLLAIALACGCIGMGGAPVIRRNVQSVAEPVPIALSIPGVVKRPWRKIFTPGLIIELVFSAMMLGFLRNGITGTDPHSNPVSLVTLVVLLIIAAAWKGLTTEHVFYAGLLCAAAGVLLEPITEYFIPGSSDFLFGLGTSFFEVVMWSLVVWTARNADLTLLAAAGSRLVAVIGHLIGTLLVAFAAYFTVSGEDAIRSGELIMIMLYFVLMIVLLKFPGLKAPFGSPSDAYEYEGNITDEKAPAPEPEEKPVPVPFVEASEEPEKPAEVGSTGATTAEFDSYVDAIAETYQLTAREHEILGLIAHGRNMPYMEDVLYISRNTLKMHIRHIYTKLDVHSKQEIIDMVESLALA